MAEAAHLLGVVSGKNIGKVANAETHLGSKGGGKQLARDLGRIDGCRRFEAIVAIAAMLGRVLAEVAQQHCSPTARSLHERRERVQPFALPCAALGLDLLLDALTGEREVLRRPEQPGFGGLSVASRAPGLLVIGLDALRDRRVRDEPDIGLIDPIPNATVAAITISSELTKAAWLRVRTFGSRPA